MWHSSKHDLTGEINWEERLQSSTLRNSTNLQKVSTTATNSRWYRTALSLVSASLSLSGRGQGSGVHEQDRKAAMRPCKRYWKGSHIIDWQGIHTTAVIKTKAPVYVSELSLHLVNLTQPLWKISKKYSWPWVLTKKNVHMHHTRTLEAHSPPTL